MSQDVLPITSMSLSGTCLVTGHICPVPALNGSSNLSMSLALQMGTSSLQQEMGDVWVWSVHKDRKVLDVVAKLGQHANPVTSVIVLAAAEGQAWEQYLRLASVTTGGEINLWEGPCDDLEMSGCLSAHSDKVRFL